MRYMAPEIFKTQGEDQAYKEPLDMWAAGVIMYQLFAGKFPFNSPDLEDKIVTEDPNLSTIRWDNVSHDAKDLCRKLLEKHPEARIKANEALKHPFFKQFREQKIGSTGLKKF